MIYLTLKDGEVETQPLLDISFPSISGSGRGSTLGVYDGRWMKLSIWEAPQKRDNSSDAKVDLKPREIDLSSDCYVQSYCILKSEGDTDTKQALFRFGSWCYEGEVQLLNNLSLVDIPYVIPALRIQQSQMKFLSDISCLPSTSPFTTAMENADRKQPLLEALAIESESQLTKLEESYGQHWLGEDDSSKRFFFEFTCYEGDGSRKALGSVDLFASKAYRANGVVALTIFFRGNWYLFLEEVLDDCALLDSSFPDISTKGSGYTIQRYPSGIEGWKELRKVSIYEASVGDDTTQSGNEVEHRLKAKLEAIVATELGRSAPWDESGKPLAEETAASSDSNAKPQEIDDCSHDVQESDGSTDGDDIYAQLDKLSGKLEAELDGLEEFGIRSS